MNKDNKSKSYLEGVVVSDKMKKSAVVAVNTFKSHKKYLKKYLVTKKYKAHDEENKSKVGDRVRIVEIKPMSKDKKWEIVYE
jgi:small subunit ribosomal protein S17